MLTTTQKVKDYLGIVSATTDTTITELVKNYSNQVEAFCSRSFGSTTYTEYFDTQDGDSKIFLRNYPTTTVSTIQYRTGTWGNITWSDFNENDYLVNDEQGKIAFSYRFPAFEKYIKVVYTGGYLIDFANESNPALHTLPFDLTQTVTEMVASAFNLRKTGGISSETTEGQSITYQTGNRDMTKNSDYRDRLNRYRNFNL
jgi:hypothetical protein